MAVPQPAQVRQHLKCCRSTEARSHFYSGKRTGGDMEGRVFALDVEELVGFLLAGNMSHKAEMGEHG